MDWFSHFKTMRAYIITEEQYQALLKELELEKFKCRDGGLYIVNGDQLPPDKLQHMMAEAIHRRMLCVVYKAIQG